jgi:hypothetical protein
LPTRAAGTDVETERRLMYYGAGTILAIVLLVLLLIWLF